MDKREDYLLSWLEEFLKNRDLILKQIASMTRTEGVLVVEKKDGTKTSYLSASTFDSHLLNIAKSYERVAIIAFHTKENVAFLKENWGSIISLGRHTQLIFINPNSKTMRWAIYPATHAMFGEKKVLMQGIDVLRNEVNELTEAEIRKLVTSG